MRAVIICGLAFALFASFAFAMPPRRFVDDSEPNNQMIVLLDLLMKQLCCRDPCNCRYPKEFGCQLPEGGCPETTTRKIRRTLEPNNQISILSDLLMKQLCCQQHLIACNCKHAEEFGCREPAGGCAMTTTRKVQRALEPNGQVIVLLDLLLKQLCCEQHRVACNCKQAKEFGCRLPPPGICLLKTITRRVRRSPDPNNQMIALLDLLLKQLCCEQHLVACNCKQAKKFGCKDPPPGTCPTTTPRVRTRKFRLFYYSTD